MLTDAIINVNGDSVQALDIMLLACNSQIDIPIRREHLPLYCIRESSGGLPQDGEGKR